MNLRYNYSDLVATSSGCMLLLLNMSFYKHHEKHITKYETEEAKVEKVLQPPKNTLKLQYTACVYMQS